eukprot:CAMPEP_0118887706 /NCGR_PEP_ID=MMETSP1163-20130328/25266_1 /TAXON_ID=124430 /ORGANISM="Phaeomonas parva, Strain CCMP2877" /LENGTH=42 /DNA_ID= /DNA_START= /DNA_END= /DNA_ORIENTATION=
MARKTPASARNPGAGRRAAAAGLPGGTPQSHGARARAATDSA